MDFRNSNALHRRLVLAAILWLATATAVWAANTSFPRGPGFYYSPIKLGLLVLSFWGWVRLASWLDEDANNTGMDVTRWNLAYLGTGLVAFLIVWDLALFGLAVFLFWAAVLGVTYLYVYYRNQDVSEADRLLTKAHLISVFERMVPMLSRKTAASEQKERLPVRFMSRSATAGGEPVDERRIERVQESRGYKAAQEMVWEAINKRSTDIHLEPTEDRMFVRLRVDGIMSNTTPFSRSMGDAVINIFKVLCNMDITEKRKPQDGSFSAQIGRSAGPNSWEYRMVDFRVATAGSVSGEKLVMRILDSAAQMTELTQVGMTEDMRATVHDLVTKPHGMFLVCGPTGSGKSTTLYAALHEIDRYSLNVITVENPVEYRLDNVTQIEINTKAGKTFAGELRSILRQDPDVIMIGEIRDKETAEIACQAAQTGHMVFSTVHANDTITALGRLIDLGVQPFMVGSALTAVLGQRLVRRLCPKCRVRYRPNADTLKRLHANADEVRFLYRPADTPDGKKKNGDDEDAEEGACEECGGTGYCRRTGIFELLVINDQIRDMITANIDLTAVKQEAIKHGWHTLYEDGARVVIEGDTSIQELLRVAK
jgi:type II secretory ATPase GspE/PulE/Tfp pilus assembly ATPase PilB-like protein